MGQLLDVVERGEEVMITRRGKQVVPIVPDEQRTNQEAARAAIAGIRERAEAYRLTVHDAAYLNLAQRRGLPLATLDGNLVRAARACGTKTVGLV
ncbi:hypothetical protein [Rhodopila sp.]|uniref:hypothetical protein n=1 Tax=Rhodopila sp. TaxID=2480087 RepID=UPI003D123177